MTAAETKLWLSMAFDDVDRMAAWLTTLGFTEHATHRDERDPSVVAHAEWLWPAGGGVMFGSRRSGGLLDNVGRSAAYLVTDDPDDVFRRAVEAGATVERELADNDYGGRGGSVRDPEGNHWSFGSYQPS